MADELKPLLVDGGTPPPEKVEQTIAAETEAHVKTLTTPEAKAEWEKFTPEQRTAKLSEVRSATAISEYVKGLKPEEKAEFDKIPAEAKMAKIADAVKAKTEAEAKANAVPEKYEFKLPDGVKDNGLAEHITPVLKELGLSQSKADKLVASYVKASQVANEARDKQTLDMRLGWRKEFETPEGQKELGLAKKGLDHVEGKVPGTKEFLHEWVGDNPKIIRAFAIIGEMVGEDTILQHGRGTSGGGGEKKSTAELLYDKTPAAK